MNNQTSDPTSALDIGVLNDYWTGVSIMVIIIVVLSFTMYFFIRLTYKTCNTKTSKLDALVIDFLISHTLTLGVGLFVLGSMLAAEAMRLHSNAKNTKHEAFVRALPFAFCVTITVIRLWLISRINEEKAIRYRARYEQMKEGDVSSTVWEKCQGCTCRRRHSCNHTLIQFIMGIIIASDVLFIGFRALAVYASNTHSWIYSAILVTVWSIGSWTTLVSLVIIIYTFPKRTGDCLRFDTGILLVMVNFVSMLFIAFMSILQYSRATEELHLLAQRLDPDEQILINSFDHSNETLQFALALVYSFLGLFVLFAFDTFRDTYNNDAKELADIEMGINELDKLHVAKTTTTTTTAAASPTTIAQTDKEKKIDDDNV